NGRVIDEQAERRVMVARSAAERVAERALAAAAALLAVSAEVAWYLDGYSQARGRVHVVPNGVNPERFPPGLRRPRSQGEKFVVGFLCTLQPWHRVTQRVE